MIHEFDMYYHWLLLVKKQKNNIRNCIYFYLVITNKKNTNQYFNILVELDKYILD